jgi:hypothetical protein
MDMRHTYQNLIFELPDRWISEKEDGVEVYYENGSSSTLRIHQITAIPSIEMSPAERILVATSGKDCKTTSHGYTLCGPERSSITEEGQEVIMLSWRLINIHDFEKDICIILVYTFLLKDEGLEKVKIDYLNKSFENAVFE